MGGLKMRVAGQELTKTVAKGNNGRLFKIKRSFLQQTNMGTTGVVAAANKVDCAAAAQTATVGCHQVLQKVDSVLIQDKSSCAASVAANDGAAYPISRVVSSVVTSAGAHQINFATAIDVRDMLSRLTPCPQQVQPLFKNRSSTVHLLGAAVCLKRQRVRTKVVNAQTVVHAMQRVVYAAATKDIRDSHAKRKQSWYRHEVNLYCSGRQRVVWPNRTIVNLDEIIATTKWFRLVV